MFDGCPPTQGILALGMNSIGYAARVFSVRLASSKSTSRVAGSTTVFSSTVPKRMAAKISGSLRADRWMHLA